MFYAILFLPIRVKMSSVNSKYFIKYAKTY